MSAHMKEEDYRDGESLWFTQEGEGVGEDQVGSPASGASAGTESLELNEYSKSFAKKLFEKYPELEGFAHVAESEWADPGTLEVVVLGPDVNHGDLKISCDGGEITIDFEGEWHGHYAAEWAGDDREEGFEKALEFLERFMNEDLVILSRYKYGKWLEAAMGAPENRPSHKELAEGERVLIRSWKGTYDREIHA